jgi:hypothetical protein
MELMDQIQLFQQLHQQVVAEELMVVLYEQVIQAVQVVAVVAVVLVHLQDQPLE